MLERFASDGRTGEGRLLRSADLEWARPLLSAALDEAWDSQSVGSWLGHPSLRSITKAALRKTLEGYLEWEVSFNEDSWSRTKKNAPKMVRTAVQDHELKIDRILLERSGVRFTFRGSIDRVEVGVDSRVRSDGFVAAIDYKSSVYSTPGGGDKPAWADGVVLQVPLYAHALTQLFPGTRVARTEYRTIRKPQVAHLLQLVSVGNPNKAPVLVEEAAALAQMDAALDAAAAHVATVRAGKNPAKPAASCMCPPFCHAWDICRTKGGPRKKW